LDGVAKNGTIITSVISEHIEYAGVHSGDASIVLPPRNVSAKTQTEMQIAASKLAKALNITGPFNIQFLAKDDEVAIIEINLRASRTFPFIAKVTGINMIEHFVDSLFNSNLLVEPQQLRRPISFTAVKVAQFSFARLIGSDPTVGVEMASTGEVACFGKDIEEAFLKGILATGERIPAKGIFVSLGGDQKKQAFLACCKLLPRLNLPIYATEKTARFLNENGIKAKKLYKIHEKQSPNILDYFQSGKIDLVINLVDKHFKKDLNDDFAIRRTASDANILTMTKVKKAETLINALVNKGLEKLEIKAWSEYR
jgi:hypothetical protein